MITQNSCCALHRLFPPFRYSDLPKQHIISAASAGTEPQRSWVWVCTNASSESGSLAGATSVACTYARREERCAVACAVEAHHWTVPYGPEQQPPSSWGLAET